MERAEMTARLLDVGYRMSLFPNPVGHHNEWDSVLSAAGSINGYREKYDKIEQKKVQDYLLFDEEAVIMQLYVLIINIQVYIYLWL